MYLHTSLAKSREVFLHVNHTSLESLRTCSRGKGWNSQKPKHQGSIPTNAFECLPKTNIYEECCEI